jgi:hypothetical protein
MKLLLAAMLVGIGTSASANWSYSEEVDQMTGKAAKYAIVESKNSLELRFPYNGKNKGRLWVRQHPKHGLDVILEIDKGQILCSNHSGCPIEVKFDDAPPIKFSGLEPADHSRTSVFFQNGRRFIAQAQKAKRMLVQVNLYQSGAPVLEFESPEPLKWSPAPPAKKTK